MSSMVPQSVEGTESGAVEENTQNQTESSSNPPPMIVKDGSRILRISKMLPTRLMIFDDDLNVESLDLPALHQGATFLKVGRSGFPHERRVILSEDNKYVYYKARWDIRPRKNRRVNLEDVIQIKKGFRSENFDNYKKVMEVSQNVSFSLIYKKKGEACTLDLISKSKDNFKKFYYGLSAVLKSIDEERKNRDVDRRFLKAKWDVADVDKFGNLTKREIVNLVSSLNINVPSKSIYSFFEEIDQLKTQVLDFEGFYRLMEKLRERPEMETLWDKVTSGAFAFDELEPLSDDEYIGKPEVHNTAITLSDFAALWSQLQEQEVAAADALALVHDVTPSLDLKIEAVSYQVFVSIVSQRSNDAYDPAKLKRYQNMTRPLSHYYIATSHCSYLETDQLSGKVSISRILQELTKGVRCLEIRCWDGENGEPVVCHTPACPSKITLAEVVHAIRQYGFKTTPFPLILCLENNCSLDQQKRIADILVAVLGRMLLMPRELMSTEGHLPSPEEAKYKVFLMSRRRHSGGTEDYDYEEEEYFDEKETESSEMDSSRRTSAIDIRNTPERARYDWIRGPSDSPRVSISEMSPPRGRFGSIQSSADKGSIIGGLKARQTHRVHPELAAIIYLDMFAMRNLHETCQSDQVANISEFQNQKFLEKNDRYTNDSVNARIAFNHDCMSRVFPKGVARADSSNFDPMSSWAAGNQLVAMNYQTKGMPIMLNDGKFRENGSCGYVLKPPYMISPVAAAEPGVQVIIHVMSAQQLPKPADRKHTDVMDPFVIVTMSGLPCDSTEKVTPVVENNAFNPVWDNIVAFDVNYPEVAQLTFRIFDKEGERSNFVAYNSIPLACVRPGLRSMPLYDEKGQLQGDHIYASLCVRIRFKPLDISY